MLGLVFLLNSKFGSTTNCNLEALHRVLLESGDVAYGDVLYIQMDNTTKDNKNNIMIRYSKCLGI